MKTFETSLPRLCVAGLLAIASIGTASASNTNIHSKLTGEYHSNNGGRKDDPSINLSLGKDGTATVTVDLGNGTETHFGHWTEANDQVTISFDNTEAEVEEPEMVFQPGHDGLQAVSWNRTAWGKVTPPTVKKGSYKVRQICWDSMNP